MRTRSAVLAAVLLGPLGAFSFGGAAAAAPFEVVRDGVTILQDRTAVSRAPVTGKGATRADFDGDGRDDVAVGSFAGVVVDYSSAPYRDLFTTRWPGGFPNLGSSLVVGNFNGDKYDDLVISDSFEADLRNRGARGGAIWIVPGGVGGLQVGRVQHINQSTAGVPGATVEGDSFGLSLAAGDITGDGRDDLAVGIPAKKVGTKGTAGAIVVLKGSGSGLTTAGARWISQATAGVPGSPVYYGSFGFRLAIGKVDKNRYQELIVSSNTGRSGEVLQFWGSASGVSTKKITRVSGRQLANSLHPSWLYLSLNTADVAVGDVNGDGYGEVVIGAHGTQVGRSAVNGGAVVTIPGRAGGLSVKGAIAITQNSPGVAGAAEEFDDFGLDIAVGDVTGDGRADVVAGVPGENRKAGAIVLLRGSAKGLTGVGSQTLSQSSAGVPDSAEKGDEFGRVVSVLNLNGAGGLDVLVGSQDEEVAGDIPGYGSGSVTRFLGGGKGLGSATVTTGRFLNVRAANYGTDIAG